HRLCHHRRDCQGIGQDGPLDRRHRPRACIDTRVEARRNPVAGCDDLARNSGAAGQMKRFLIALLLCSAAVSAAPRQQAPALKPTGVLAIINFKKDGGGPGPDMDIRVEPQNVIADALAAGLELRKKENFLRYQYMLTFGPASAAPK